MLQWNFLALRGDMHLQLAQHEDPKALTIRTELTGGTMMRNFRSRCGRRAAACLIAWQRGSGSWGAAARRAHLWATRLACFWRAPAGRRAAGPCAAAPRRWLTAAPAPSISRRVGVREKAPGKCELEMEMFMQVGGCVVGLTLSS